MGETIFFPEDKSDADRLIETLDATIVTLEGAQSIGVRVGQQESQINARIAHIGQLCRDWLAEPEK